VDRSASLHRVAGAAALLAATACAQPAPCGPAPGANDRTLCLPERAGPLRPSTSRAALDSLFRADRVRDQPVDVGEGMSEPGTLVNIGLPDSARIVWSDSSRSRIASVLALGPAWRTQEGLGVGSSLADIERALGPVEVLGFGWDYGGTVMLDGTRLENSGLFFRTAPRTEAGYALEAYERVRGDRPYPSSHLDVRSLDLVVSRIDVTWR
jgi:hypothetical protein